MSTAMMDTTITMSSCMVVTITTTTSVLSPRNRWATIKPRWQLVVGIPYKLLIYELFIYLPTPLPPPPVSLDVPSCHKVPVNANNPCVTPNPVVRIAIQTNLADNNAGMSNSLLATTMGVTARCVARPIELCFGGTDQSSSTTEDDCPKTPIQMTSLMVARWYTTGSTQRYECFAINTLNIST